MSAWRVNNIEENKNGPKLDSFIQYSDQGLYIAVGQIQNSNDGGVIVSLFGRNKRGRVDDNQLTKSVNDYKSVGGSLRRRRKSSFSVLGDSILKMICKVKKW